MVSFPNFFMDAGTMSMAQLLWAFSSYGYVLFVSSGLISDGSELLLLIPSLAGMVGSIVLPILGAVPDGMMVLFSGMNPDVDEAQKEVAVGVGALAGSTIMLLTIPWFLAIYAGRVDIGEDGNCDYKTKLSGANNGLYATGVQFRPAIKANAKFMILSSFIYFIILIPSLSVDKMKVVPTSITGEAQYEHAYALVGVALCLAAFCVYLFLQYKASQKEEGADHSDLERKTQGVASNIEQFGLNFYITEYREKLKEINGVNAPLTDTFEIPKYLNSALKQIFDKYARGDGLIDRNEFEDVFRDLHIEPSSTWIDAKFKETDDDSSGYVEFKEFIHCFKTLVKDDKMIGRYARQESMNERKITALKKSTGGEDDEDEEEAEEVPEEWADLPPDQQKRKILMRSFWMMGLGTVLVLIFSDPMVDVLSGIGEHTGVSAFYVSFILAPLASNASELVAAYSYALKKTSKTITISMSTLEGAACMNNTFCLGIFFSLIYVQGLAWRFTAETLVIVGVQVAIGIIAMLREVHSLFLGLVVLSMYPCSLLLVYFLENVVHLD